MTALRIHAGLIVFSILWSLWWIFWQDGGWLAWFVVAVNVWQARSWAIEREHILARRYE